MTPRLRALAALQRVEERALEQLARELTTAQNLRAKSEARIIELQERAATEGRCTSPEAMPYIGRFVATLRREQGREAQTSRQMSEQIDGLQDQVMKHFTAGRTWENLSEKLTSEILAERLRKSEAAIEDMISARFKRGA